MTSEIDYILDSEYYWKDTFDVRFKQHNANGTEWWIVKHKPSGRVISCNSMILAFKIALVCQERLEFGYMRTKLPMRNSVNKACYLLYGNKYLGHENHKMNGDSYYNRKWHTVRRDYDKQEFKSKDTRDKRKLGECI